MNESLVVLSLVYGNKAMKNFNTHSSAGRAANGSNDRNTNITLSFTTNYKFPEHFFVNENSSIGGMASNMVKQRQLYIDYGRVDRRRHSPDDTPHETSVHSSDDDGWSMTIPISNKIDREIIMG